MSDRIESLGASTVQHGPLNDRVYLMHLAPGDGEEIVERLGRLADRGGRSKVFAKVPTGRAAWFTSQGYVIEAEIPPGPGGEEGLVFVSRFVDPARGIPRDGAAVAAVLERARVDRAGGAAPALPPGMVEAPGGTEDAEAIARLYGAVFESYPFPIHEPDFIRRSMDGGVRYVLIRTLEGRLVAVSSAEPAGGGEMLEMTDFATAPDFRGQGLARRLLATMVRDAHGRGIPLSFTIARAVSAGMNLTFHRGGYRFAGTLVNNTNISGGLESMNVWYRWHGHPVATPAV